ncbi:MAG: type IV pilus assembly protein PilM [Proteobacteria bacterium]|nr:type IV pilus assembly protein PilM [Pseudomonadota bacterium]
MAKGKLLLGLDIGSSSAKICLLRETRKSYEIEALDREIFPVDAIVDGSILDRTGVVRGIRTLLTRNKIKQKQCAIAISGYNVIVKRLRLSNMSDDELAQSIRWEVEQHIPYEYNEVVYDTVVLNRNTLQNSMDILLVASKREVVNDYISVAKDAGLDVKVVDVASFALQNMVETVYGESETAGCVGVINIGAAATSMTMMTDGVTSFTRDITIGGNQITEEIQKKLGVTREEAEAFKTGNESEGSAIIPHEVNEIIRQVSEMIANEIKRSLTFFYETSGRDRVDKLILCGGVIKNDTTLNILESTLSERVIVAHPFENMPFNTKLYSREAIDRLSLESAVALGLALRRSVE